MSALLINCWRESDTSLSSCSNFGFRPALMRRVKWVLHDWIISGPVFDFSGSTKIEFESKS